MPKLSCIARRMFIQGVFELRVSRSEIFIKGSFIRQRIEIERLAWVEDDGLLRKIAIVGIIETICACCQPQSSHVSAEAHMDYLR